MRFVSLFAGVGGFDLGAEQAGWECVAQVEWNRDCRNILERHWPHVPRWEDINDVHGADLPACDVIVGGFPCQDVSTGGKRRGMLEEGTRSNLYRHIIRIVKEMQHATTRTSPRWVILENVRGLLTIDNGTGFQTLLHDLADLGAIYTEWAMLDSQHFGVPQRRQRIFTVACLDPATAERSPSPLLPVSEKRPRHPQPKRTQRTEPPNPATGRARSSGIQSHTDNPPASIEQRVFFPTGFAKYAEQVGPLRERDWKGEANIVVETPATYSKSRRAKGPDDFETWIDNGIAPTLNSFENHNDMRATVLSVDPTPNQVRRITPLEAERLQGWPDNHTLIRADGTYQPDTTRYRQIGNGITSTVAHWVCTQLNTAENHPPHQ